MKKYVKPCMYAEEFVSNEYISTCYKNNEERTGDCHIKSFELIGQHSKCDNTTFTMHTNGNGQISSISFRENQTGQTGNVDSYNEGTIKWTTSSLLSKWHHEASITKFSTTNRS